MASEIFQPAMELMTLEGAVFAWPLLLEQRGALPPVQLAEAVWAASAVPSPPKAESLEAHERSLVPHQVQIRTWVKDAVQDLLYQAVGLARELTPELSQLPDEALYRCVYGLARIHSGRGSALFLRSAQRCAVQVLQRRPLQLMPRQLVRFCWSLARLGCRENVVYEAFENSLRDVLDKLQYKDLEALYSILTELERVNQWKLIHDVERAMASRGEDDKAKRPRKTPFRRRWTRADLMHTVLT